MSYPINQWEEKFSLLSVEEKIFLEIISLAYTGINFKEIYHNYTKIKKNNYLSHEICRAYLSNLLENEFIELDFKSQYICNKIIQHIALQFSFQIQHFKEISGNLINDLLNQKRTFLDEDIMRYSRLMIYRGNYEIFPDGIKNVRQEKIFKSIIHDSLEFFNLDFYLTINFNEKIKPKILSEILDNLMNGWFLDTSIITYLLRNSEYVENSDRYKLETLKYLMDLDITEFSDENPNFQIFSTLFKNFPENEFIKNSVFSDYKCFIILFYHLKNGESTNYREAVQYLSTLSTIMDHQFHDEFKVFRELLLYLRKDNMDKPYLYDIDIYKPNFWKVFSFLLIIIWGELIINHSTINEIIQYSRKLNQNGFKWYSYQLDLCINKIINKDTPNLEHNHYLSILDFYKPILDWKAKLMMLSEIQTFNKTKNNFKLIWEIQLNDESDSIISITPFEEALNNGIWVRTKIISLKNLYEKSSDYPYLNNKDYEIIRYIKREIIDISGSYNYKLDLDNPFYLLNALNLFLYPSGNNIEFIEKKPSLVMKRKLNNNLYLSLLPTQMSGKSYNISIINNYKIIYYRYTEEILKISEVLGGNELMIPPEGESSLLDTLFYLSEFVSFEIEDKIEGEIISSHISDSRIYLKPIILDDSYRIEIISCPGGKEYGECIPFQGSKIFIYKKDKHIYSINRDFEKEKYNYEKLLSKISLFNLCKIISTYIIKFESLEFLLEFIYRAGNDTEYFEFILPIEVQEILSSTIDYSNFQFYIKKDANNFRLEGNLSYRDSQRISFFIFYKKFENNQSRFIEIEKNQYLVIHDDILKKLQEIIIYLYENNNSLYVNEYTVLKLNEILKYFPILSMDSSWEEKISKLKNSSNQKINISNEIYPFLRNYQIYGVSWMIRTLEGGAGVCLADEMGLGKTIQTIAVLLNYIEKGAFLVVCPTSVIGNWEIEIQKYSSKVNIIIYNQQSQIPENLDFPPNYVILLSYSLLQREKVFEILSQKNWMGIILDEAQMIKNSESKRSIAVRSLQSQLRIATTGTPIENNIGELWSLFDFLNPGLLPDREKFKNLFEIPISKNKDFESSKTLKKLIDPFILRRLKENVLVELPEKTEIIVNIEFSTEEKNFYNSIRAGALQKIQDSLLPDHKKRIQILSEIMKLRRACCHPIMVDKAIKLASSKVNAIKEYIKTLIEGNHKILVFSQFIEHLAIVRDFLDSENIQYQYLDGKLSAEERTYRVKDFQDGKGDVFLISLKAGGFGLNLTSADYVLHLDPWWNPAVEAQATDRAHRFGQKKPVTVYKFIVKDSIEEKILKLHNTKRDLSNYLMDDLSEGKFFNMKDLEMLIRGEDEKT